jgi:hypothetical protein
MKQFFKLLHVTKASYGTAFESRGITRTMKTAFRASRFFLDDNHRARHLATGACHASIEFTKSFWNLAESTVVRTISNVGSFGFCFFLFTLF